MCCVLVPNIPVVIDADNIFTGVIIAIPATAGVRVVLISLKAIIPNVVINVVRKTSTAALILIGVRTIDNLLD